MRVEGGCVTSGLATNMCQHDHQRATLLQCHNWSVLHSNEAFLIYILADREALRIEQYRRPM